MTLKEAVAAAAKPTIVEAQFDFDRIDQRTRHITPALIIAVTDRIVYQLQPARVILFGSQASNTATPGSDIDLLIVLDDTHPWVGLKHRDRYGKLLALFPYRLFGLDCIVLTEAEIQALQASNEGEWDLILEILAHGKTLYDRA
jgi:predicted nucleotidyltransferase